MTAQTFDAFQVIADPSRRQMLRLLSKDTMTINALAENFDMSRPGVSKHIKIMHNAGFIFQVCVASLSLPLLNHLHKILEQVI